MPSMGLPFFLEDESGSLTDTTFTDHYGRLNIQVSPTRVRPDRQVTTFRILPSHSSLPAVILDYGPGPSLGSVIFPPAAPIPMEKLLRKTSRGSPLSRKFTGSDGTEFIWCFRHLEGQEWTCLTATGSLVAHYDTMDPKEVNYKSSGSMFVVSEQWCNIAVELLATLNIMRHIAKYNI